MIIIFIFLVFYKFRIMSTPLAKLNEYAQKNNCIVEFIEKRVGGEDHAPLWKIILLINKKEVNVVTEKSKGEGKQQLAKLFLDSLANPSIHKQIIFDSFETINFKEYSKLLFIDADNLFPDPTRKDFLYLYFSTKNAIKDKIISYQCNSNVKYIITPSTIQDANDHNITLFIGKVIMLKQVFSIYILTKDHFGEALEKLVLNCKVLSSLIELEQI